MSVEKDHSWNVFNTILSTILLHLLATGTSILWQWIGRVRKFTTAANLKETGKRDSPCKEYTYDPTF